MKNNTNVLMAIRFPISFGIVPVKKLSFNQIEIEWKQVVLLLENVKKGAQQRQNKRTQGNKISGFSWDGTIQWIRI